MKALTSKPWSLILEIKLIGIDYDNLLEAAFQLGRLWREHLDGIEYPVDMHDPSGPAPRAMSDETGEDATYWFLVDALDGAKIDTERRKLEIMRAAHFVCARLAIEDEERGAEWGAHGAEIRELIPQVISEAAIAAWAKEWESKR